MTLLVPDCIPHAVRFSPVTHLLRNGKLVPPHLPHPLLSSPLATACLLCFCDSVVLFVGFVSKPLALSRCSSSLSHLRCLNPSPPPLVVLPRFFTAVTLASCAAFPPVLCDVFLRADCHAGISSGGCTGSIQVVLPPLRLGAQGFVGVDQIFTPLFSEDSLCPVDVGNQP